MRKHENGAAHVAILGAVVVALIGTLSYIFWNNYATVTEDKTDESAIASNISSEDSEPESLDELSADWITYSNDQYTFSIPDGWNLSINESDVVYALKEDLQYNQGSPAKVNISNESPTGLPQASFVLKPDIISGDEFGSDSVKTYSGVDIKRLRADGMSQGDIMYYYEFQMRSGAQMQIAYGINEGDSDYSKQLEAGLKRLELK